MTLPLPPPPLSSSSLASPKAKQSPIWTLKLLFLPDCLPAQVKIGSILRVTAQPPQGPLQAPSFPKPVQRQCYRQI